MLSPMDANDFSVIDAQDEVSRLAQVDHRELGDDVSEHDGEPDPEEDGEPRGSHDMSDDAEALASAGHGTDEDYGGGTHEEDFGGAD